MAVIENFKWIIEPVNTIEGMHRVPVTDTADIPAYTLVEDGGKIGVTMYPSHKETNNIADYPSRFGGDRNSKCVMAAFSGVFVGLVYKGASAKVGDPIYLDANFGFLSTEPGGALVGYVYDALPLGEGGGNYRLVTVRLDN